MPSGHEGDDELFARAWDDRDAADRGSHPVRRPQDPVLAADLDLAAALRDAGRSLPGPDDDARARMRAHLMSEIGGPARPGTETRTRRGTAGSSAHGPRTERTERTASRRPAGRRSGDRRPAGRADGSRGARRLFVNVVSGACAVMLLAALTVLISRGSLPGEMLYNVKRASESVELGLTSGQEEKGLKHLDFAAIRLEEVSDLVGRSATTAAGSGPVAAGLDPTMGALVLENLQSFDQGARMGARLILPIAAQPSAAAPVDLSGWARSQSARLDTLSPSLPEEGRTAVASSQQMLQRLSDRASALDGEQPCATGTSEDDLGPLPAEGCVPGAAPAAPVPAPTETTTTSSSTSTSTSTSSTTTTTTRSTTTSEDATTDRSSATRDSSSASRPQEERDDPAPVRVPLPVPLLPQVDLPPLLPGLPGISLG